MYMWNKPKQLTEHEQYLMDIRKENIKVHLTRIIILITFFILWEIAARLMWIDSFITSQPTAVYNTLISLTQSGELFKHLFITIGETVLGFILGTIIGTLIAIMLWWSPFISRVLDPFIVMLNSLPKVALGPIIIVWAGAGITAVIVMALLISTIITIINVYGGFNEVDSEKVILVQSFGATKKQVLQKVILPASYPAIINALKINVGLSWVGVIMGEFLVSKAGLGYLIVYGSQVFKLNLVMTSILVLAIASVVMYIGVAFLEKKLIK